jgi:hypothetical protein
MYHLVLLLAFPNLEDEILTPWRICMRRCGRNARRCAKSETMYARRCSKSERRYARREGRNSNSNKHHCLHLHHQFHPKISTGSS